MEQLAPKSVQSSRTHSQGRSLGPSEGAWGAVEEGMKRERDGGIGGRQGSHWERCRSGLMAKQKGGKESEMSRPGPDTGVKANISRGKTVGETEGLRERCQHYNE
ncbi:zinc finger protein 423-like protein [Lates japonicus]|uniref:Zinc finger protein 423-like protein n=1 Tax=Lates japonicus TaxID=270547 RepID=A0AAD3M6V2_LATJO|nr:zinc finger protein 423-like protein [Lates japonicus]